jgi:DNA-directed RNA polymerase subunit RPC12/RpoP
MYCGRKIWAKDRLAHTQVKCPACGHTIRVKPADARTHADREESREDTGPTDGPNWQGMSDREIARELRKRRPLTEQEQKRQATRRALSPFMPHYDSLTLFALSSTFLVLLLLGPNVSPSRYTLGSRYTVGSRVPTPQRPSEPLVRVVWSLAGHFAVLVPLAGIGMILSLLGVFYPKPKPEMVKWLMLCFAVVVTGGTGIYAGYIWLTTTRGWLVVFPAWNILNAAIPLLLFRAGLLDTELILDTAARLSQVVVTLIVTTALLALCLYVFKLHWAIAYSICVGYTMSLNHAITDVFGGGEVAGEVEQ